MSGWTEVEIAAAEVMRKAIADKLQDWVDELLKGNGESLSACNFASAKVVALLTYMPPKDNPNQ